MIDNIKEILNNPRFYEGAIFVLFILTGKFFVEEVQENLKILCHYKIIKYAILYAIAFVATHDYKMAGLLTFFSILIFDLLLNPKSVIGIIKVKKNKDENEIIVPQHPIHTTGTFGGNVKTLPETEEEKTNKILNEDKMTDLERMFM